MLIITIMLIITDYFNKFMNLFFCAEVDHISCHIDSNGIAAESQKLHLFYLCIRYSVVFEDQQFNMVH